MLPWRSLARIACRGRPGRHDRVITRAGFGTLAGLVAESRGSGMRTNPILLADEEVAGILAATL
jgi:hypothetical protein